ncbi:MAG: DUF2071 domain-containing protein [Acidobacteriia bacterium]|nr:DUF2071 domain-containing protein [Terriglobia bacterium]
MASVLPEIDPVSRRNRVFLSAEWRDLVMLNYVVDPGLLQAHVPPGTVLDSFEGRTYVSLVGFRFLHTRLRGTFPVPFHANFDEVNLRFYVRRKQGDEDRRGVVFIAEIVPKWAVAKVARLVYAENYTCLPMRHRVAMETPRKLAEYQWQLNGHWCKLRAEARGTPAQPDEGSVEQFITEHYWGYSTQRSGGCLEYHVAHPPWRVWAGTAARFEGDARALYGADLAAILQRPPDSAFIADGSPVIVYAGQGIS